MMTLDNILKNERFSELTLINSNADLSREVSTIESTETPDISKFLAPNTFLLTTAMAYKEDQKGLCDLIVELNNLPCAGLGIKLGRFIHELDEEVIETANRLKFPLIKISTNHTLGNTFHELLSYLWQNQNEQLVYSLNIQKKFSNLMIRNASLNVLLRNLSNTLKKSIALVDPFGNVTSSTNSNKVQYSKKVLRNIVEHLAKKDRSSNPIDISLREPSLKVSTASIYSINMASYFPYYLIIFDADNLEYPISTMAIEQAILILAFTLYKNLRVSYNDISTKVDFLKDLVSFKTHERLNESQLLYIGEKYGLQSANSYQVIIGSISNRAKVSGDLTVTEEWYTLIYNWLDKKLKKDMEKSILFPDVENYDYIILLQDTNSNLINRLVSYRLILQKTLQLDMNFYVGNVVQDINLIKYSYKEAIESMESGETRDNINFIKYYNQLDTLELLHLLPKSQMENFISNTLKSLAYPDDETLIDFKNTLKTFLELNCNITDTANALFIHRNTVKYRIKRCEEILGQDITDPNYSLQLRLSLAYLDNDDINSQNNHNVPFIGDKNRD